MGSTEYAVCTKCKKQRIDWNQFKDGFDTHPVTKCGLIILTILFALALLFGSDISALIIIGQHDCDMIESEHVNISVTNFLQVGAWFHVSVLLIITCCFGVSSIVKGE